MEFIVNNKAVSTGKW